MRIYFFLILEPNSFSSGNKFSVLNQINLALTLIASTFRAVAAAGRGDVRELADNETFNLFVVSFDAFSVAAVVMRVLLLVFAVMEDALVVPVVDAVVRGFAVAVVVGRLIGALRKMENKKEIRLFKFYCYENYREKS